MDYQSTSGAIRELQDTVVTLRMDIPTIYKGLLKKECETSYKKLFEAKVDVPRQPVEALQKVGAIEPDDFALCDSGPLVQEVTNRLDILEKILDGQCR